MYQKIIPLLIFVVAIFLSSCSEDDPVEHHEEHFEADGIILYLDSEEYLRIYQGQIESERTSFEMTNSETLGIFTMKFIDDHGDLIDPPDDLDKNLSIQIDDEGIASYTIDSNNRWGFSITAISIGVTQIEIRVQHEDHFGFRTPKIDLNVSK